MSNDRPLPCRCGHSYEKHLGYVGVAQDPCAGGTPGFCGCPGYAPAPPPPLELVTCADLLTACTHSGPHVPVGLDGHPAPSPAAEPPHELREQIAEALNREGACCGDCGREPGDPLDDCSDCRRCLGYYVDALLAGPLAPLLDRLTRAEAAVQRVEALAARYEDTSRRRRLLAEKWQEAGRWQLADAFRNLARQSDVAADRTRAALSPESVQS